MRLFRYRGINTRVRALHDLALYDGHGQRLEPLSMCLFRILRKDTVGHHFLRAEYCDGKHE